MRVKASCSDVTCINRSREAFLYPQMVKEPCLWFSVLYLASPDATEKFLFPPAPLICGEMYVRCSSADIFIVLFLLLVSLSRDFIGAEKNDRKITVRFPWLYIFRKMYILKITIFPKSLSVRQSH